MTTTSSERRNRIRAWRAPELRTSLRTRDECSTLFQIGSLRPRRDWVGRGRRSDRDGCGSGADGRRRDPEPRGASAKHCRAEHSGHRRKHAEAPRQSLRAAGPRPTDLKGIAGPVRAWAALRASLGGRPLRSAARERADRSRWPGRKNWNCCCAAGRKQRPAKAKWCSLSGEAGIGKSRLTAALLETIASEPHTRLRYFCSPQHTDSALYPVIGQMERAAGFVHDDTAKAKLDKLDAVLAQTSTRIEDAALFAEMLSLPNDGRYPALDLTPEQRRQRTLEALVSQMEALIGKIHC